MSGVKLVFDVEGAKTEEGTAINRMYPKQVVDLFAGEQLVIVGRYKKPGDAKVTITGKVGHKEQKFDFPAKLVEKSDDQSQAFVEKLWAVRRVGEILDEIDLSGKNDELIKELVSLSLQHGIMTPYTSFLADENAKRGDVTTNLSVTRDRLSQFDYATEGQSGVEQRIAKHELQAASQPAATANGYFGGTRAGGGAGGLGRGVGGRLDEESAAQLYSAVPAAKDDAAKVANNVRQVGNKAFYRQGDRWVDSSVDQKKQQQAATKIKRFSQEYFDLVDKYGREAARYLAQDEPITIELGGQLYDVE